VEKPDLNQSFNPNANLYGAPSAKFPEAPVIGSVRITHLISSDLTSSKLCPEMRSVEMR